jgi:hypothetical protein
MNANTEREKIVAIVAIIGCCLIFSNHPKLGAVCMGFVAVLTILGFRA